mgnify:CR=1 FL=1
MSNNIFADFGANINAASTVNAVPKSSKVSGDNKLSAKEITSIAIPLAAIPVTAIVSYKLSAKNVSGLKHQIKNLTAEIAELKSCANGIVKEAEKAKSNDVKIWTALAAAAGITGSYKAGEISQQDKDNITGAVQNRMERAEAAANTALYDAQKTNDVTNLVRIFQKC